MKTRNEWITLAALTALIALGGCITLGKPFPAPGGLVSIELNKTTQDQIQKTFGNPNMEGVEDGDATWTYLYLKAGLGGSQAEHLTIRFNKDATVHSYSFNSNLSNAGSSTQAQ